jgi:protocatechuate 3,4-dioxygenase beta subunit
MNDHDLSRDSTEHLLDRRRVIKLMAGVGAIALVGCGSDSDDAADSTSSTSASSSNSSSTTSSSTTAASDASCTTIPEETAGPYPGDGSNGPNVLTEDGVVRSDIRSSIGSASGVAEGVPLTIDLTILDTANGCTPLTGVAVYLWHCDRDGNYSMYSEAVTGENYLRGVQETDGNGAVSFTSIFPGAYSGRWPHIHFEVFPSLADATDAANKRATSQLAFPEEVCAVVYAADGYGQSMSNLAQTSLDSDMVFSDGYSEQLATTTGSVEAGYVASLSVPV